MTDLSISSYATAAPAAWTMDFPAALELVRSERRDSPQWCEAVLRVFLASMTPDQGEAGGAAEDALVDILGWWTTPTCGDRGDHTDTDGRNWSLRFMAASDRFRRVEMAAERAHFAKVDAEMAAEDRRRVRRVAAAARRAKAAPYAAAQMNL